MVHTQEDGELDDSESFAEEE
ncbi:hypothetical protein MED121_01555 [Marinomonas sp. MED121]|nr:hypothetical protein MED121_01555 [Marinomonas sp. MED121]